MEQDAAQIEHLLTQSIQPDSAKIKEATDALKQYYTNPVCVPVLAQVLFSSQQPQIRQLAAVELRKQIAHNWGRNDEPTRSGIKAKLLEVILQEQQKLARHAMARVISAIATIELKEQHWGELLQWLFQCSQSPQAAHREVGIYVLYTLFDVIADHFEQHKAQLFNLFATSLNDPESHEVRVTTLKALGQVAEWIEPDAKADIKTFRELIPGMVQVVQQCFDQGDEDGAKSGVEVFDDLLMWEAPLLNQHFGQLVEFFLTAASNSSYDDTFRNMSLSWISWALKYKKSKAQSLGILPPVLEKIMPIIAGELPEDDEDDVPSRIALRVIDSIATNFPPSQFFPPLVQIIAAYAQNADPNYRRAALMSFAMAVEGTVDFIRQRFDEFVPLLVGGLKDPDTSVRKAACIALVATCDQLDDEVAEKHEIFLPPVFELVNDPNVAISKSALSALDALLESLGDSINAYLETLMTRMIQLIDTAPLETKGLAVASIGSAAHAAQALFEPYFDETMKRLVPFMALKKDGEESDLRGVSTDTIGTIAAAVGKHRFQPYVAQTMELAFEGIQLDHPKLRECSFCYFAILARTLGDGFAPYVQSVVPHLITCLKIDESNVFDQTNSNSNGNGNGEVSLDDILAGNDDEDLDEEELFKQYQAGTAIAEEKETAAEALAQIFSHTRATFLPYAEETVTHMVAFLDHYQDGLRTIAVSSLLSFLETFYDMSAPNPWESGVPVKVPLHQNVASMALTVMPTIINMLETEDEMGVCTEVCALLASTIKKCGPAILTEPAIPADVKLVEKLCQVIHDILAHKSMCQMEDADDLGANKDDEEQAELETALISSASDVVSALAIAFGASFAHLANTFIPAVAKYYKKKKSLPERSLAIGCLGEITLGMKGEITPYTETLLSLFVKSLQDEEGEVRSNAAFGIGLLCQNSNAEDILAPQYGHILQLLHGLFDGQPLRNITDNAMGAVARMLTRRPQAAPLAQVIPVLLAHAPCKKDFEENEPIFDFVVMMLHQSEPTMTANIPRVLEIITQVLLQPPEEQVSELTQKTLTELIRTLNATNPELNISNSPLAPLVAKP